VHELVDIPEPRHDEAFWRRVERAMPDYVARKEWLAEHGHQSRSADLKAAEANFLKFLKRSDQLEVPIYQRTYSWTRRLSRRS